MKVPLHQFLAVPILGAFQVVAFILIIRPSSGHALTPGVGIALPAWLPLIATFLLLRAYIVKFLAKNKLYATLISFGACILFQVIGIMIGTMMYGE